MEFVLGLTQALAWPMVVLVVAVILRRQLAGLVERLEQAEGFGGRAVFRAAKERERASRSIEEAERQARVELRAKGTPTVSGEVTTRLRRRSGTPSPVDPGLVTPDELTAMEEKLDDELDKWMHPTQLRRVREAARTNVDPPEPPAFDDLFVGLNPDDVVAEALERIRNYVSAIGRMMGVTGTPVYVLSRVAESGMQSWSHVRDAYLDLSASGETTAIADNRAATTDFLNLCRRFVALLELSSLPLRLAYAEAQQKLLLEQLGKSGERGEPA